MAKQTIEIDSRILGPFRQIAAVLGVPVHELIETVLEDRAGEIERDSLSDLILLYFADLSFPSRRRAEAVAERIEAFAIESSLAGRQYSGTVSTGVGRLADGSWTVKIDYLSAPGGKWHSITVLDDGSEGEEWKG
jgi:hypothetical protein